MRRKINIISIKHYLIYLLIIMSLFLVIYYLLFIWWKMGKGILNWGTKVHKSKTKKFKWEDELDNDKYEFKLIKKFIKGHTPNDEDEKVERIRKVDYEESWDKRNRNLISLEEYSLPSTN